MFEVKRKAEVGYSIVWARNYCYWSAKREAANSNEKRLRLCRVLYTMLEFSLYFEGG